MGVGSNEVSLFLQNLLPVQIGPIIGASRALEPVGRSLGGGWDTATEKTRETWLTLLASC